MRGGDAFIVNVGVGVSVLVGVTEGVSVLVGVTEGVNDGVGVNDILCDTGKHGLTTKFSLLVQTPLLSIVPPVIQSHTVILYPVSNSSFVIPLPNKIVVPTQVSPVISKGPPSLKKHSIS